MLNGKVALMKTIPDDFINPQAELTLLDQTTKVVGQLGGLTKREHIIFSLYITIVADNFRGFSDPEILKEVAKNSISAADVLFEELNK
jgi:hypothetical protein